MPYSIYNIYVRNVHVHIVWYKATRYHLRKKRALEKNVVDGLEAIGEIDPVVAKIDNATLDIVYEERGDKKKRQTFTRPNKWEIIADYYKTWGKNSTIRAYPLEFGDRSDRSASQALLKWSSCLKRKMYRS